MIILKRSLLWLPEFVEDEKVQQLRLHYDPLGSKIGPHLTFVFPFESPLTNEAIIGHIAHVLETVQPFEVVFSGVTGDWPSGYLYLNVKKGNDQLIALHDQLYQGLLSPYLWRECHYLPHITVGKTEDYNVFQEVLIKTQTWQHSYTVNLQSIVLETIAEDGRSVIDYVHHLGRFS